MSPTAIAHVSTQAGTHDTAGADVVAVAVLISREVGGGRELGGEKCGVHTKPGVTHVLKFLGFARAHKKCEHIPDDVVFVSVELKWSGNSICMCLFYFNEILIH